MGQQEFTTIYEWNLEPQTASIHDLSIAFDWVMSYETDDQEFAQKLTNAANFIAQQIKAKQKRNALNDAKREYAKTNGLKFSQVRIKKVA